MPLISCFDPWHSSLCTCPAKLTFNPYTGCDHQCLYCYATNYIPNHQNVRIKKNLLPTLRREIARAGNKIITMSTSSDPYPTIEAKHGITRQCLKIIANSSCRLQLITKSDIVQRDIDLLKQIPCTVALTITTNDDELAAVIEPNAPPPSKRIKAIESLIANDLPVIVRIDPIIPSLNDNPDELIKTLADLGVKHITSSTYRVKYDNWKRLKEASPKTAEKLYPLYFTHGQSVMGNKLLPKEIRFEIMNNLRKLTDTYEIKFGLCREEFPELRTVICDGSWLMPKEKEIVQCTLA